jgi:hypothetical protein
MEETMIKFFKDLIAETRKMKAYRSKTHQPQDTFVESWQKARDMVQWQKENLQAKRCTMTTRQKDIFKLQFEYWDEWSSSRFVRRRNPTAGMSKRDFMRSRWSKPGDVIVPAYVPGSICRINPVTGSWDALSD